MYVWRYVGLCMLWFRVGVWVVLLCLELVGMTLDYVIQCSYLVWYLVVRSLIVFDVFCCLLLSFRAVLVIHFFFSKVIVVAYLFSFKKLL